LILVNAGTLLDGNPLNNFLERALTFNPEGILAGARNITIAGTYAYVCCDAGLVVISIDDPKQPKITEVIGQDALRNPRAVQVQFRYGFVCDDEGIKVLEVTQLDHPRPVAALALAEAHNIYLARTYAYVAAGSQGLVVLDITNPERPRVDQVFDAGGSINDLRDVKLGITNASEFAYLADGCNGLRVVQLTSPETPGSAGFSPRPAPQLVASYKLHKNGRALAISKGVDRDRAVDESGNQLAVFGRIGARPLNRAEQQRMYLRDGKVWKVGDFPYDPTIYRWLDRPPEEIDPRK
jgi:LVIVD repeat